MNQTLFIKLDFKLVLTGLIDTSNRIDQLENI